MSKTPSPSPNNPRSSIFSHRPTIRQSIYAKGAPRKSQPKLAPMKIFVSNNKYYNYSLERISYPNSQKYVVVGPSLEESSFRVTKRESIVREPFILSYQKVNMISYKIAHTAFIEGENINSDHICKIDHETIRCSICGCHLGWQYTADHMNYPQPVRIDYFDYETLFFEENFDTESFISFKNIRNLLILRKYFSYIVDRKMALGFQELYGKYKLIGLFPQPVFKELGITYREMLEKNNEIFHITADFEGGNLQAYHYLIEEDKCFIKLLMRSDTNILEIDPCSWFFFKITAKTPVKIYFEVLNFKEKSRFFDQEGYISIKDEKFIDPDEAYSPGVPRWRTSNENVYFQLNPYKMARYRSISNEEEAKTQSDRGPTFLSLNFDYFFEKASKTSPEEVLFSTHIPYLYEDLLNFVEKQEKRMFSKAIQEQDFNIKTKRVLLRNDLIHYERIVISHTRAGVPIFLIKITSSITADETDKNEYFPIGWRKKKRALVFFARQHPCETSSSWLMEGLITNLLNDQKKINYMRMFFCFYLVPMINVDGVIVGNSKNGVSGADFNRIWEQPIKEQHPEVFLIKEYFKNNVKEELFFFFDLHGTTDKYGFFLYSNPPKLQPKDSVYNEQNLEKHLEKLAIMMLFPRLLKRSSKFFNEKDSRYRIKDKNKENTARSVFGRELNVAYSYSLVSSQYFYLDNKDKSIHLLKIEDFKIFAKEFLSTLLDFTIILAEKQVEIDKKEQITEKNKEKSPLVHSSSRLPPRNNREKDKKINKKEEIQRYFFDNLSKGKVIFDIQADWKHYFTKKEMRFLRHKAKAKLIPWDLIISLDKIKKKLKKNKGENEEKEELNEAFLENLLMMKEKRETSEENHETLSNSIDLEGNISVVSENEKDNSPLLTQKGENNGNNPKKKDFFFGVFKELMNNSKMKGLANSAMKFSNNTIGNNGGFDLETSKRSIYFNKEKNMSNSTFISNNNINNSISQAFKRETLNSSLLNKSLSFHNKSTVRATLLDQSSLRKSKKEKLFRNKSSSNLKELIKSQAKENFSKNNEVFNDSMEKNSKNIGQHALNRMNFMLKIKEKLKKEKEISVEELKKVKIPLRRDLPQFEEKKPESLRITWRLRRPCSLGMIPVNPFIKTKKEIIQLYSFTIKKNADETSKTNENFLKSNKENTGTSERKANSVSPWKNKRTDE